MKLEREEVRLDADTTAVHVRIVWTEEEKALLAARKESPEGRALLVELEALANKMKRDGLADT